MQVSLDPGESQGFKDLRDQEDSLVNRVPLAPRDKLEPQVRQGLRVSQVLLDL